MRKAISFGLGIALIALGLVSVRPAAQGVTIPALSPAGMARIGTVDARFQSYNVEMVEVTGGRFWRPYGPELDAVLAKAATDPAAPPAFRNPAIYEHRPPIDLTAPRLRTLAAALGPAYVRVSGTWANSTYFPDSEQAPSSPPAGFGSVLTRQQWRGVAAFARAVDAAIVTSFATSAGTRDATGLWTTDQARRIVDFTKAVGSRLAAAEFMNEPNAAVLGGAPAGYDAAAYGRDFTVFRTFARQTVPDMLILGPGSVGETDRPQAAGSGIPGILNSRDLLAATGPGVDAVSYHHYGAASKRCAPMMQTTADAALSEEWFARTDDTFAFYRKLRDNFEPGRPMWLTETADAACGGNPWGSSFLDSFRYLDQLGRLAKQGVQVVAHNTLVASAYGLLEDDVFTPKPNYWAALLWRRLMGTGVLESGVPIQAGLHVYAHCQRDAPGGVVLLVLNTDRNATKSLEIPAAGTRFSLTAPNLEGRAVQLNGATLALSAADTLPSMVGTPTRGGTVTFAPTTITFMALPAAGNAACR